MKPVCQVCGRGGAECELIPVSFVRPAIAEVQSRKGKSWDAAGYVCWEDLTGLREQYVLSLLEDEKGELTKLEQEVVESVRQHDILATNLTADDDSNRTIAERMSDGLARFGGSWRFIVLFGVCMAVWITINSIALFGGPFDPFPYILLNLILSCLAAIQAPIIMMSQNRLETRDRLRSEHDYQVNLKAELEIRQLHEKLDHLLMHQWQRLMEIQQVQLDLMKELSQRVHK